jgi:glycosyltransferase involved in cell wall biosynthesis
MKPKVVFISPKFSKGGAERNMLNVLNSLDASLFEVHLWVCTNNTSYISLLKNKVKITYFEKKNVKNALIPIFKKLLQIRPELVYTSAGHISLPITLFKKIRGLKFLNIVRIPSLPSNKLGKGIKAALLRQFEKKTLRWSDFIIAQSNQMKKELTQYYGLANENVLTILNPVNFEQINRLARLGSTLDQAFTNFVAAGSLYSVKGFDVLIKAFALFYNKKDKCRLYILGDESVEVGYKKYLMDIVSELKIEKAVFFEGFQDNPYKYYFNADAFVLSSIKEGFPNVILEALALQVPVLATNCVDFEEIIKPGENGIIVEKGNVEALAIGLNEILKISSHPFSFENFNYNHWFETILKERIFQ